MICINCLMPRAPLLREKDNASLGSPKKRACKSRERRRGAAAAEFAIVLPVFVLLIVGILEFGRMIMVQSLGDDPGMEIIHKLWPDDDPFQTGREAMLEAAADYLAEAGETGFKFTPYTDRRSVFRYRLHPLPSEVERSIGLSTTMSAWNAAVYVAQIEDERLAEVYEGHAYMEATQSVLKKHGGLWFQDESFVISRPRA